VHDGHHPFFARRQQQQENLPEQLHSGPARRVHDLSEAILTIKGVFTMTTTNHTNPAVMHTPGPWEVEYLPYTHLNDQEVEIPMYRIFPAAAPEDYICETNEHVPDAVQDANAQLIKAAPDMLEALLWQEMAEHDPEASRRKGYFDRARELRRAAIAQVKGR
jgi:hypothetical protein